MHHIHHTEAIVLDSRSKSEADKQVYLYTRGLGLVRADARGIRKLTSKLRFALQPYMIARTDLISTKTAYRVGSTDLILSIGLPNMETLSMLHRVTKLIRRLVPEEEKNEALYDALNEIINFLSKKDKIDVYSLELITVLRILFHLGYITENDERSLVREPITEKLLEQAVVRRDELVKEINRSLRETML